MTFNVAKVFTSCAFYLNFRFPGETLDLFVAVAQTQSALSTDYIDCFLIRYCFPCSSPVQNRIKICNLGRGHECLSWTQTLLINANPWDIFLHDIIIGICTA